MKNVRNLMRTLCILVLFLFTSCQNDIITEIDQEETLQKKSPFISSLVSQQEVEANTKLSMQMRSLATSQTGSIAKDVYNDSYHFTIHTDVAKFAENIENNAHSYTFAISRENNIGSALENLVFSYDAVTDDYKASLVTYHFTAFQRQEFIQTSHVGTSYDITYEPIAISFSNTLSEDDLPCTTTYQEFHEPHDSDNSFLYSTNGYLENGCRHEDGDDPCDTYTVITVYCPDGGSTSSGNSTDDASNPYTNPNNTASGGSTTNDTNTPPPSDDDEVENIVTSPISREESTKQSIIDCINSLSFDNSDTTTIDEDIFDELNLSLNELITFNNYLQENGCSEAVQQEVIEDLLDAYDEYQIINELQGKALCVYNKLKSSSSGFKNAIKLFDGEFPVANLKYENTLTLPSLTNAQTLPPSNFLINIQINENNLNRPNLSIARTIIHETIHAEMFRKILSILDNGGDLDGLTRTEWLNKLSNGDYPGIYDYYVRFGLNDMQHEQIAAHYRNVIENMLIEFQPGLSQNIYEALAWVGLRDTETWNALTDVQKATITSTINTFNALGAEQCN